MNCPSCGRALASGARQCVYCGQGSTFRPKEQIQVPEGSTGYRKRTHWGRWFLLGLVVAGVLFALSTPGRAFLQPWIEKVKSFF